MIWHLKCASDRIVHQRASAVAAPSGKLVIRFGQLSTLHGDRASDRILSGGRGRASSSVGMIGYSVCFRYPDCVEVGITVIVKRVSALVSRCRRSAILIPADK